MCSPRTARIHSIESSPKPCQSAGGAGRGGAGRCRAGQDSTRAMHALPVRCLGAREQTQQPRAGRTTQPSSRRMEVRGWAAMSSCMAAVESSARPDKSSISGSAASTSSRPLASAQLPPCPPRRTRLCSPSHTVRSGDRRSATRFLSAGVASCDSTAGGAGRGRRLRPLLLRPALDHDGVARFPRDPQETMADAGAEVWKG